MRPSNAQHTHTSNLQLRRHVQRFEETLARQHTAPRRRGRCATHATGTGLTAKGGCAPAGSPAPACAAHARPPEALPQTPPRAPRAPLPRPARPAHAPPHPRQTLQGIRRRPHAGWPRSGGRLRRWRRARARRAANTGCRARAAAAPALPGRGLMARGFAGAPARRRPGRKGMHVRPACAAAHIVRPQQAQHLSGLAPCINTALCGCAACCKAGVCSTSRGGRPARCRSTAAQARTLRRPLRAPARQAPVRHALQGCTRLIAR